MDATLGIGVMFFRCGGCGGGDGIALTWKGEDGDNFGGSGSGVMIEK